MEEKIKSILGSDDDITVYLDLAIQELISWCYGKDSELEELPKWLEPICVMAVVTALTQSGAEGETSQMVDGVQHNFKYETMIAFIHNNAPGYAELR